MNPAADAINARAKKGLFVQAIAGVICAIGFLIYFGVWPSVSALAGAGVSIALLLLLRRGMNHASEVAQHDQKRGMIILYMGAAQRFLLILVLFALGLGVVEFDPLAMFVGFFLAQLSNLTNVRG